jgi:ATP-dependent exoDNAse (exonuclease V) beta subunit
MMPTTDRALPPDHRERERALDPATSFIVQAPAGSGKTELLIQRFLALLARVNRPEEISAITFTIKAAAEMRGRVLEALRRARTEARPESAHEARTWDLARAALARNDAQGWKLEESAERLRVQTIDALCASLTRQMPVLSQFGAQPEVVEDASALYGEAARSLLDRLEEGGDVGARVERLLTHLDNNAGVAERLIADMLMGRDHWIRTLKHAHDRRAMTEALDEARAAAIERVKAEWPAEHALPWIPDVPSWIAFSKQLVTPSSKTWRKDDALASKVRGNERLRAALLALHDLPAQTYSDEQWETLEAIVRLAPLAVAELQWVFAQRRQCDFVEVAQGALRALGDADAPTDLLLALDYRIHHILVDEFQDTSYTQFELLEKLMSGWVDGDGRTLFLVGDPMQSIYRFREAEVGLFLKARQDGIGSVHPQTLTLSANFRSRRGIVDWVNRGFGQLMPEKEDIRSGAVKYTRSEPVHGAEAQAVRVHSFFDGDTGGEGACVASVVREALALPPLEDGRKPSVAILARSRSHLVEVIRQLREQELAYRAIEIEPLGHRPVVLDLLALARAISHAGDRTAWIAVLRAPWCGLKLADLQPIAAGHETRTVWEAMNDASLTLSPDGGERLARTRQVLARAVAGRLRSSLRAAVEGAWLALGGPACVENATDLEDADIFLDHLEQWEDCGGVRDLKAFEESLGKLFALPDLAAPETLQVMTIHKAKGLEFDTVIVPGLGLATGRDDSKLFMWMETQSRSLLLAPINAAGGDEDDIYRFIRRLDKEKGEHEIARLLYVAATRARRRLHLMGDVKIDARTGEAKNPTRGTLLHTLWPVVQGEFAAPRAPRARPQAGPAVPVAKQGELRRVATGTVRLAPPPAVSWAAPKERAKDGAIEFSWVGDTARRVGSVVHRWLQRIAEEEGREWTRKRIEREKEAVRRELAARGVIDAELEAASERVIKALALCVEDKRGKWLVGPQRNARNEYRLSARVDGVPRMLVIDRMFEDDVGDTWVVDYKTSGHEGADLEGFLAREQERYRGQLDGYVEALGNPAARRGLYFPLLKGWREWY